MLLRVPLILLALIAYNVVVSATGYTLDQSLGSLSMISGAIWSFTVSDALLVFTLLLLFVEVIKATRTDTSSIVDHALSTVVFILCLVEFLLVDEAATSTFLLITLMALIDVVAGYSITIRAARRDFAVGPHADF